MKFFRLTLLLSVALFFSSQTLAAKQFYVQVEGESIHLLNMPHPNMALPVDQAEKGWILHVAAEYTLVDGTTFYEIDELDRNGTGFIKVGQVYPDLPAQAVFIRAEDVKIIPDPKVDPSSNIITVSTVREFLEALGSNRTIILQPGQYKLSDFDPNEVLPSTMVEGQDESGIVWKKEYDGHGLQLWGLSNLTIMAEEPGSVTLIVDPRYVEVLTFIHCDTITLKNLIAGHSEAGDCTGGVFYFSGSTNIHISDCRLFGSGVVGLTLNETKTVTMNTSTIFECTHRAMEISRSENITCNNSLFHNNAGGIFADTKSHDIVFESCAFTNNGRSIFINYGATILVKNTSFTGNNDKKIQDSEHVTFENCIF
ncbi:MAG: right-handed parallel beta-helix repeat-containing protein [Desulfovibrionales bacterium]|nr:right-handed parallel beta-helix repeat-containing protein [Desulfovibrionales bacterium]